MRIIDITDTHIVADEIQTEYNTNICIFDKYKIQVESGEVGVRISTINFASHEIKAGSEYHRRVMTALIKKSEESFK